MFCFYFCLRRDFRGRSHHGALQDAAHVAMSRGCGFWDMGGVCRDPQFCRRIGDLPVGTAVRGAMYVEKQGSRKISVPGVG